MKPCLFSIIFAVFLFACGGDDDDSPAPAPALDAGASTMDAGAQTDGGEPPPDAASLDAAIDPPDGGDSQQLVGIAFGAGEASVLMRAVDLQSNTPPDLDPRLLSATIRFLDADGTVLQTVSPDLGSQASNLPGWVKTAWWPTPSTPSRAEVEVFARMGNEPPEMAALIDTRSVDIAQIPVTDDVCDPAGFDSRCGSGQGCLVGADASGTCRPLQIDVRTHPSQPDGTPRASVDVRADVRDARPNTEVFLAAEDGLVRFLLRTVDTAEGWRATSIWAAPEGDFDVFFGPHLYAADRSLDVRPERALGEPCDVLRVADQCTDDAVCGADGTCGTSTPPTLETMNPYYDYDREILVVEFTGLDPERDIRLLEVELQPAGGGEPERFASNLPIGNTQQTTYSLGQIAYAEDGTFTGVWYAVRVDDAPPAVALDSEVPARSRLTLRLTDREGGTSGEPRGATILPALPASAAAIGAVCDVTEVLYTCAEGSFCAIAQGEPVARCQRPPEGCEGPWEILPFTPPMVMGDLNEGPDQTIGSCSSQRADLGQEHVYAFFPENEGLHTFSLVGGAAAMFLRPHCALRGSEAAELGCARADRPGTNTNDTPITLAVELEDGVPVYLFVESAWHGGGPYTLSVDTP